MKNFLTLLMIGGIGFGIYSYQTDDQMRQRIDAAISAFQGNDDGNRNRDRQGGSRLGIEYERIQRCSQECERVFDSLLVLLRRADTTRLSSVDGTTVYTFIGRDEPSWSHRERLCWTRTELQCRRNVDALINTTRHFEVVVAQQRR